MGLLSLFSKPTPTLLRLPSGSVTVDREGVVVTSTLSSNYPAELVDAIASHIIKAFRSAAEAQLPLVELSINYPSLRITAKELRGGAILFLSPKVPYAPSKQH
jgi:hypothetical protein